MVQWEFKGDVVGLLQEGESMEKKWYLCLVCFEILIDCHEGAIKGNLLVMPWE